MPFPQTIEELKAAGYKHEGESPCRGCTQIIEWWRTPGGKLMPMNAGTAVPHWSTCPKRQAFKEKRA